MLEFINIAQAGIISDAPSVSSLGIKILNFLLSVVGFFAIISLVLAGIKYFFALGDKKQIENAKNAATAAVWGIALAMGGMILIRFIGQFFQ